MIYRVTVKTSMMVDAADQNEAEEVALEHVEEEMSNGCSTWTHAVPVRGEFDATSDELDSLPWVSAARKTGSYELTCRQILARGRRCVNTTHITGSVNVMTKDPSHPPPHVESGCTCVSPVRADFRDRVESCPHVVRFVDEGEEADVLSDSPVGGKVKVRMTKDGATGYLSDCILAKKRSW
jgi:hypothetical protein